MVDIVDRLRNFFRGVKCRGRPTLTGQPEMSIVHEILFCILKFK